MRRLVVDMQSSAPHMRLPGWAADEITANTPDGWEVVHVATQSRSLGNGTNEPSAETLAAIPAAEAYFGYGLTPALLAAAPALRWAHSASAGIGESITPELRESRVVFTNGAGIYAEPMADTVLGGVLHFVRGLDLAVRLQAASIWDRHPFVDNNGGIRELSEYRVLVIGAGGIGSAVAQRLQALGCECIGVRRRPALGVPTGFARVVGPDALDEVLPLGDITVVAAPLTDGTRSLLDGARMALLPAGAIVVNVARGPLVDDAALLEGLESGRLRGAVLDVFSTEPLPADSPWWQHPRVLVTPHVSGVSPQRTWQRGLALFMDNWRRWSAGERLHNVVDLDAGY